MRFAYLLSVDTRVVRDRFGLLHWSNGRLQQEMVRQGLLSLPQGKCDVCQEQRTGTGHLFGWVLHDLTLLGLAINCGWFCSAGDSGSGLFQLDSKGDAKCALGVVSQGIGCEPGQQELLEIYSLIAPHMEAFHLQY